MKVREYLEYFETYEDITFVIGKAMESDYSDGYDFIYKQSPIRGKYEWLKCERVLEMDVIAPTQAPIEVGGGQGWSNWYKKNQIRCTAVASREDVLKVFSEKQAMDWLDFIERETRDYLDKVGLYPKKENQQ